MDGHDVDIYRRLLRESPALVVMMRGREGRVELVSDMAQSYRPWATLPGKTMRQAWPFLKGTGYFEMYERVFDTGEPMRLDEAMVTSDRGQRGKPRPSWFNINFQPYRDGEGKVLGVLLYGVDVTEAVLSRRALEESRKRLELAQEAGGIGVYEWVIETGEVIWSPEVSEQFGIQHGTFEGTYEGWTKRVHPEDVANAESWVRRAVEERELMNMEIRIIRPDGSVRWQLARARVLVDEQDRPRKFIGMVIDITDRKLLEERLKDANERITKILGDILDGRA